MAFTPRLKADGRPCCFRVTEDGRPAFPSHPCDACAEHFARAASAREDDFKAPDPYAPHIRAAAAETGFAAEYAETRRREFAETRAALDVDPLELPRLTAAELAEIPAAPNGYTIAIERMKR